MIIQRKPLMMVFGGHTFEYDDDGRIIHDSFVSPYGKIDHVYFKYDELGRLKTCEYDDKITSYEYDEQNRLIHENIESIFNNRCLVDVRYVYGENGCVEKTTVDSMYTRIEKCDDSMRVVYDKLSYCNGNTAEYRYTYDDINKLCCRCVTHYYSNSDDNGYTESITYSLIDGRLSIIPESND